MITYLKSNPKRGLGAWVASEAQPPAFSYWGLHFVSVAFVLWLALGSFSTNALFAQAPADEQAQQATEEEPPAEAAEPDSTLVEETPAAEPATTPPTEAAPEKPAVKAATVLAAGQGQLGERFKQLQRMMLHLAEFSANSDPHRAAVLRQAISESEQQELVTRFQAISTLLEKEQYALAEKSQLELRTELEKLVQLLLKEDRANRLDAEKKRIEGLIKEVGRIIKDQRGVKARTEGGDDLKKLGEAQKKIGGKAKDLAEQIAKDEAENKAASGESPESEASPAKKETGEKQPAEGNPTEQPATENPKTETPATEKPATENMPPVEGTPPEPGEAEAAQPGEGEPKPSDGEAKPGEGEPKSGEAKPGDAQPMPDGPMQKGPMQPGPMAEGPMQQGQSGEPNAGEAEPMGETPPPPESENERVRKRIEAARERMDDAQKKLDEAERKGAAEEQQAALDELEQAKAELEKILRQLREEEVERTLAQLEDRFRRMLKVQIEVYEGTKRLDAIATADRDRDDEIEAGRLSRLEAEIVTDADKALNLLHDEGSAVAFPEAVGQMRDDMEQIVVRLAQLKSDKITQGLEEDVIAALEEMVAALKKAQKELEEKKNQGQPPQQGGEPGDQSLVDALAELRMIRALQMRVNTRTKLYSSLIAGEQAEEPELLKSLEGLAERQQRIHQVTRDLHLGKNK